VALINLARVALREGDLAEGGKLFGEALTLAKERGDKRAAAECLQGLGAVASAQGDAVQASRLLGAAEGLLESIGATPSAIETAIGAQVTETSRSALGEERLAAESATGRSWLPETAIELALSLAPGPGDLVAAPA
jgi:hypothetical protein